jgi:hypothetical protein
MSRSESRKDGLAIRGTVIDDSAYEAYQLHIAGKDWETVAKTTGYANAKTAQVDVRRYIQRAAALMDLSKKEEVIGVELSRLDALQDAVWGAAMEGDTKAVDSVLKVMTHRSKLLGLELIAQDSGTVTNNTVVVQGNTQDFIRSLRLVDGHVDPFDEGSDGA